MQNLGKAVPRERERASLSSWSAPLSAVIPDDAKRRSGIHLHSRGYDWNNRNASLAQRFPTGAVRAAYKHMRMETRL